MPSRPCSHPTCSEYVARAERFCPTHADVGRRKLAAQRETYNCAPTDPKAKAFYNSAAWQRARAAKLTRDPVCEWCRERFATTVHHVKPLAECSVAERTSSSNLMSVCGNACHAAAEAFHRSNRI